MDNFKIALEKKLSLYQNNNWGVENYDEYRFGELPMTNIIKISTFKKIKRAIKSVIGYNKKQILKNQNEFQKTCETEFLTKYEVELQNLYDLINTKGKELIIDLVAYRILGYNKVKLSRNNKKYWEAIKLSKTLIKNNDTYNPNFLHFILDKCDLNKIGHDIQFYYNATGVAITYIIEQYAYKLNGKTIVSVEKGDVVLDCGACWGDTALYFASKTGSKGKVYSFEFIPNNIKLFNMNIAFNKLLQPQIELVPHPISNKSGVKIYFKDEGPSSKMKLEPFDKQTGLTTTIKIDDFVINNNISKVDFIKMDIEGAEPVALEGAIETIKKFKPKLAIAIYHSIDDFVKIPLWINELNLGYKLYIDHYTIHAEETIIFAKIQE